MKLCVINTGGTISCIGDPLAPMSAFAFAKAARSVLDPVIAEMFPDTTLVYETGLKFPESRNGSLDSTNLQPSDWCIMARCILENYAKFDGFVVLHGTDSMDFTGSALPFLLNVFDADGYGAAVLSKPVILTGSQVPMFQESGAESASLNLNFNTDAFQNFCGALACARLGIPEVGVYFDGHLFRGNRVLKVNASEFRAFNSRNYPPLARYGIELTQYSQRMLPGPAVANVSLEDDAALDLARRQVEAIASAINLHPVMQFNAFPATYDQNTATSMLAKVIEACVEQGIRGLILESYGEGNFPSGNPDNAPEGAIFKALDAANRAGVVIVDSTQVIAGSVDDGAYAAGAWLSGVGSLSGGDMTPMAALAKTTMLLSAAEFHDWTLDQVKSLIQMNLCGEVKTVSRLDNRRNPVLLPGESLSALDRSATLVNDAVCGPCLKCRQGTLLWAPFGDAHSGKPGRLVLQGDGNLVLRNAANVVVWSAQTDTATETPTALSISGSLAKGTLALGVYDYGSKNFRKDLFRQQ